MPKKEPILTPATIATIGAGIVLIIGIKTISTILEGLGLTKSKDGRTYDEHMKDPNSFWGTNFWRSAKPGTVVRLLTNAQCVWLYNQIYDSFGIFDDDEDKIYSAFDSAIKTQSQLSYFSYWVSTNKGKNLLSWLHGGNIGPVGDHLSVKEINVITQRVEKLPKWNY